MALLYIVSGSYENAMEQYLDTFKPLHTLGASESSDQDDLLDSEQQNIVNIDSEILGARESTEQNIVDAGDDDSEPIENIVDADDDSEPIEENIVDAGDDDSEPIEKNEQNIVDTDDSEPIEKNEQNIVDADDSESAEENEENIVNVGDNDNESVEKNEENIVNVGDNDNEPVKKNKQNIVNADTDNSESVEKNEENNTERNIEDAAELNNIITTFEEGENIFRDIIGRNETKNTENIVVLDTISGANEQTIRNELRSLISTYS